MVSWFDFMKYKDYCYEYRKNVSNEIKNYINDEDEIIVLGNRSYYYLLFDKMPNFKYFFQVPIINYDQKIKDETEKYIIEKRPKVIINEMYDQYGTLENDIIQIVYGKEVLNEILNNYEEYDNGTIKYYVLKI